MRVRVRLHQNCVFEIGGRTAETRSLVKQYVEAFRTYAAAHAGRPPGARQVRDDPPTILWEDANWRFTYTLETSAKSVTITIIHVALQSRGGDGP
jgi:hypothetical protein